jgi:hypothetical protein
LNESKIADKKFILENIDANHLLIKSDARDEILRKVEEWMDMVRILVNGYYIVRCESRTLISSVSIHCNSHSECLFVCREGW